MPKPNPAELIHEMARSQRIRRPSARSTIHLPNEQLAPGQGDPDHTTAKLPRAALITESGDRVEIPREALDAIVTVLEAYRASMGVLVRPIPANVRTFDADELVGYERGTTDALVRDGKLSSTTHNGLQRVNVADLVNYRESELRSQQARLNELFESQPPASAPAPERSTSQPPQKAGRPGIQPRPEESNGR